MASLRSHSHAHTMPLSRLQMHALRSRKWGAGCGQAHLSCHRASLPQGRYGTLTGRTSAALACPTVCPVRTYSLAVSDMGMGHQGSASTFPSLVHRLQGASACTSCPAVRHGFVALSDHPPASTSWHVYNGCFPVHRPSACRGTSGASLPVRCPRARERVRWDATRWVEQGKRQIMHPGHPNSP